MPRYELVLETPGAAPERFPVDNDEIVIGRSAGVDIILDGGTISRRHARIWIDDDLLLVEDLGSRNGVRINGERVNNGALAHGDKLQIGKNLFTIVDKSDTTPLERGKPHEPKRNGNGNGHANGNGNGDIIHHKESASLAKKIVKDRDSAQAQGLLKIANVCGMVFDSGELQRQLLATLLESVPAQRAYLFTRTSEAYEPQILAWQARQGKSDGPGINRTMVDHVLRNKAALMKVEGEGEAEPQGIEVFYEHLRRGAMCVPLVGRKQCVGAIYLDSGSESALFNKDDLEFCTVVGQLGGVAIENAQRFEDETEDMRREAQEQAAARLGHALKDGLSGIKGAVRILAAAAEHGEPQYIERGLPVLYRAIERIDLLSDNMLSYARTKALDPMPLDVNTLIERVIEELRDRADRHEVLVEFERSGRAIAHADDRELFRLVLNLVNHAIDACEQSGGGAVTIRAENKINGCHIRVADTGFGLAEDELPVHEADFALTSNVGLAISVSHKIARELGGQLSVKSEVGEGTVVTVVLPQQAGVAIPKEMGA